MTKIHGFDEHYKNFIFKVADDGKTIVCFFKGDEVGFRLGLKQLRELSEASTGFYHRVMKARIESKKLQKILERYRESKKDTQLTIKFKEFER